MPAEADFPTDLQTLERDYELIRELGQGGMAAVYLARRRDSGRLVAIKAVRARYLDDPDALQRFAREARTVADLDHPNIVRTEAIEQIDDRAVAIIMEYVAGGTVRDRLREYGSFMAEDAESVLRDVAHALAYAHRRGIVHRDVKPENVFLDSTSHRAVLSDFGIARRIAGDAPITLLGSALGTPQYMSPEQIDGRAVDERTDIYSLGVLGWELLTGRRPWAGENLYGVIYKQKHEDLPRITTLRPRVPANLLFAIEGALVKDRERRWQTVEEFLRHLTYDAPPVLAQAYPAGERQADDVPTVELRRTASPPPASSPPVSPPLAASLPASTRPASSLPASPPPAGAETTSVGAARRYAAERPRARRVMLLALALVVPLAIAATSWYVLFGGRGPEASNTGAPDVLTSSAGTVALDSTSHERASPPLGDGVRRDTAARASAQQDLPGRDAVGRPPKIAMPDSTRVLARRDTSGRSAPPTRPREGDARTGDAGQVKPRVPEPASPETSTVRATPPTPVPPAGSVPSPRCRVATMADQRACLLAYIAVNDAALQGVYDSLIVELRRIGGAGRGAPDPTSVTRLRVEQRAWIAQRDRECTRSPSPGSVPFWAQPLSECFAEMSAARAAELGDALRRVRGSR